MYYRLLLIVCLVIPLQAFAGSEVIAENPEIVEALKIKIRAARHMAMMPSVISAVVAQNQRNMDLDEIKNIDKEWRSSKELTPFKSSLQKSKTGRYLQRRIQENSSFNEVLVTDNQGANVAAYPVTSNYWQGDQDRWSKSFNNGDGVVYVGPVEVDEGTNTSAVKISAPVISRGKTLGVLVLGVTFDYASTK